ncbi:MAG: hypothetical protein D6776_00980 [Planctomycetota bacterium]|nr:MAG: hypothetical protein D6776_00980 [Planctomycetota bacterium]
MATLELATTIAPYARILVASEEIEPGSGWAYDRWLASFAGAPERTAATLGSAIAQTYMDSLAGSPCHAAATMSVIDLDQIVPLAAAVDAIALDLASLDDATILAQVTPARRSAVEFDQRSAVEPGDLVDLGHFARRLQQEVLDPAVRTRLDRVLSRLQDAVIVSVAGSEKQGASGLSIYMPVLLSTPYNGYDRTLFAVTNRWFDFVERYRDAVRTDVTRPSLAVASLSPPNRVVTPATPLQVTVGTNDPDVYRLVGMVMYYNGSWYIVDGVDFTGSSSLGWSGDIPLLTDGSRASFLPLLPVAPGNGLSVVAAQLGPERSLGFLLFDRDPTSAQVRFAGAFHSPDGASVGIYPLTDGTPVRVLLPSYNAGTGRWSFTVSPVTVTYGPGFQVVADAQPGTYQLLLLAEDHAGNWGGTAVTGISRP